MPPASEFFIGTINGELVCHVLVVPMFTASAYRATRLVVMPEWQGAGVGLKFLNYVMQYHLEGNGRCHKKIGTFFHTTHPQLCSALRFNRKWIYTKASLYGANKKKSMESIRKSAINKGSKVTGTGYGGHFRAVQSFKYIGDE